MQINRHNTHVSPQASEQAKHHQLEKGETADQAEQLRDGAKHGERVTQDMVDVFMEKQVGPANSGAIEQQP